MKETNEFHLLRTCGAAPSIVDGLGYNRARPDRAKLSVPKLDVAPEVQELMVDVDTKAAAGQLASASDLFHWGIEKLKSSHGALIRLLLLKVGRSWYATDTHRREGVLLLIQLPLICLAIGGLVLSRSEKSGNLKWQLSVVLIFYFWGMTVIALSIVRYMVPVMPFVIMHGAAGVTRAASMWRSRKSSAVPSRLA
ncbi:MAG: hypothetical protein O3A00_27300 [Planctomycetota bacterium]|nr:hypothetical protein [Planctomycetota bacterium]